MSVIIITGTPGTGKTCLGKKLATFLNYEYIDVNDIIFKNKLNENYDKKRDTFIVDEKKLVKILNKIIKAKKNLIIESHMAHHLNPKHVNLCIVTKCNLKVLRNRLKNKGYSKSKVRENLDAEIFDICLNEAYEKGHNLLIIDTSKKKPEQIIKTIFSS